MGKISPTKVVQYTDPETGLKKLSEIPSDAPVSDAPMGVPLSIDLSELGFPEHFKAALYAALWDEGLRTPSDFRGTDSLTTTRRILQRLIKADANVIRDHILRTTDD